MVLDFHAFLHQVLPPCRIPSLNNTICDKFILVRRGWTGGRLGDRSRLRLWLRLRLLRLVLRCLSWRCRRRRRSRLLTSGISVRLHRIRTFFHRRRVGRRHCGILRRRVLTITAGSSTGSIATSSSSSPAGLSSSSTARFGEFARRVLRHVEIAWAMGGRSLGLVPGIARPRSIASLPLSSNTWNHDSWMSKVD